MEGVNHAPETPENFAPRFEFPAKRFDEVVQVEMGITEKRGTKFTRLLCPYVLVLHDYVGRTYVDPSRYYGMLLSYSLLDSFTHAW